MTPTPTSNAGLPYRRADFGSLPEALDYAARGETGFNFHSVRGELVAVLTYRELRERALDLAVRLVAAGLPSGGRVLLIADTDPDFMVFFLACQYAALLPVPVAVPTSLGGRAGYVETLRRQLQGSGAAAAMAQPGLLPYLREAAEGLPVQMAGAPEEFYALPGGGDLRPFQAGDPSYLQYSSGSTRFPLGVDVPQRALLSNAYAISSDGLRIGEGDRCTSWLPLYHDMGLVGFMLVPLLTQRSVDYLTTRDFARRPLTWLSLMSRNGGTLSFSPTFGYDLAARRAGSDGAGEGVDLSRWRAAGIGGDMIQPPVMTRFAEAFAPNRFSPAAFVPSYGMAETTLAVSFSPLGNGMRTDTVDRRALAEEARAVPVRQNGPLGRTFVLCGRPLADHTAEVRAEDGTPLPDRRLGRIFVKGPSVMAGYFQEPDATARVLGQDGWLDTGDLGYRVGEELVITGRSKDLIIINGKNIWPQDLEWALEDRIGLRRGDTAAFAVEEESGAERVVVMVHCRPTEAEAREKLAQQATAVVSETAAVEPRIALVPPHTIPQTSSGKISRAKAKALYLRGIPGGPAEGSHATPGAAQPGTAATSD